MSQGLSLLQAPPFVIVFSFFITACTFSLIASLFELYLSIKGFLILPPLVHLYTLGFGLFTMFGTLFQMLPVVAGAVIKDPKPKAFLSYSLLLTGSTLFILGFFKKGLLLPGSFLVYIAITYTSLLMLWHLFRIKAYTPTPLGFRYALILLMVGATIGFYQVLSYFDLVPFWNKAIHAHLTILLFGWIGLLVASVSFQVVEMFFITEPYNKNFSRIFPTAISISLLLATLDNLLSIPLLLLFLAYSYMTIKRLIKRRKRAEPVILFWYISQTFLMVSLLLYPFTNKLFVPFLFSFLVFFSSIIMGMMYRITPFLVWFHLSNMPSKRVPLMSEVIPYGRIKLSFYLHALWVACVILSFITGKKVGFIASSFVHFLSSLFFLYNIAMGGSLYFRLKG